MGRTVNLTEYLANTRELLRLDAAKFRLVIERQVQFRVLPGVSGSRAALEPQLWELLVFCLDGHDAAAPAMDEATFERAQAAAQQGRSLDGSGAASFPQAARAVLGALDVLREAGVYPRPVLSS